MTTASDNNLPDVLPRVVVTGIGLVTPFGVGREISWRGLLSGESATRLVDGVIGAPAPTTSSEPMIGLALLAAAEAVADAGLPFDDLNRNRIGCVIGTSKPGLRTFAALSDDRDAGDGGFQRFLPNAATLEVAKRFRTGGPCLCPVAACATGLVSLQRGYELIRDGQCDVVIAGSSDASLVPIVVGSFQRMGVLAKRTDNPAAACRPFDRDRNGFVIGEGAGVLILERLADANARGANIIAEWLGGGTAADGSTLTGLDETGGVLARLIGDVLRRTRVLPAEIDYVNLHGTATKQNDRYETRALQRAFGRHAQAVSCSSLKGGIGHLLGAAGSVETAATLLAMRDGVIPPTVNLVNADPDCDLDYTPGKSRKKPVRTALKLSLGFGGHLAAAVLRTV